MVDTPLSSIPGISHDRLSALKKGGLTTTSDVLFSPPSDIARKCTLTPQATQDIIDSIARELSSPPRALRDVMHDGGAMLTTGDASVDRLVGGGIRVGMIWELSGEGASGKTQLALQLSLLVQLPVSEGGLDGSACFLTTSSTLPTSRLAEILQEHPLLVDSNCTLDNIQTSTTKSVDALLYALTDILPTSMEKAKAKSKPLKLLIIDSLADIFLDDKTSTATLIDRSHKLSAIGGQLHALAATHQLAVVAINRVTEFFERRADEDPGQPGEILYQNQSRFFRCADGSSKGAALGLGWANQVNVRIMLARTRRRYVLPEETHGRKRQRVDRGAVRADDIVVRRLSVLFGSVCAPGTIDFLVTPRGVEAHIDEADDGPVPLPSPPTIQAPAPASATHHPMAEIAPLDVGAAVDDFQPPQPEGPVAGELDEDEEDAYWREVDDFEFVGDGIYLQGTAPL
ncbi:Rad51-domain-containing protein [Gloeopeniophorella convolvens]|nr:Rad51-domain-containing protein [Gloeopeniophorella convolvens]